MSDNDLYQQLGEVLEKAGMAEQALFLNWGYQDPEQPNLLPGDTQKNLVLALLNGHSMQGQKVLDVGCGRGGTAWLINENWRVAQVTGVDLSLSNIDFCRKRHRHPRLRFQLADACKLPQPNHSVDTVVNIESSGAYDDLAQFFQQVWRVLKPGGDFFYSDIFAQDSLPDIEQALLQLGFERIANRSIRNEVLCARKHHGSQVFSRMKSIMQTEFNGQFSEQQIHSLRHYFALPDTPIYKAMQQHRADYHSFHFRKPINTVTIGAIQPNIAKALQTRRDRLEAIIQGNDTQPEAKTSNRVFPVRQPQANAEMTVFALPFAGGGASVYREWGQQQDWPENWQFCALQLPGRENRIDQNAHDNMTALVADLAQEIAPYTDKPWALVGCSLGCKVAFELAHYFKQHFKPQQAPKLLYLMACPAPDIPINHRIASSEERIFTAEVKRLGGTPEDVLNNPEMMSAVGKALRGDCALAEAYLAPEREKLNIPAVLVAAEDDHLVPLEQMLQWQNHFTSQPTVHRVTGGHFFIRDQREQQQQWLVDALVSLTTKTELSRTERPPLTPRSRPESTPCLPFGVPKNNEGIPVFCFHHAGGNATSWWPWKALATKHQLQICPVELPGHASRIREPAIENISDLVAELVEELSPWFDQKFLLMGHSLGSLIAFEIAQTMPNNSQMQALVVSGRRPPHCATPPPIRHLKNDPQLTEELLHLEGTPKELLDEPELMSVFLPIIRADFCITETYPYQKQQRQLATKILAFCGDDDQEVSIEQMEQWLRYSDQSGKLQTYSGGHFYLNHYKDDILKTVRMTL